MVYLRNGKDSSDAIMDLEVDSFPTNNPGNIYIFCAGYLVDTDFDGDKDLILSPNDGSENSSNNFENSWQYENTGNDDSPVFNFQTKSFA